MKNYFLSAIAEQDIDEIVFYIAQENPEAAMRLLDAMYDAMDMLALNSKLGYKKEYVNDKSVRFWPLKWNYLIVYKDCSPIEIVRILSGYRDMSSLLN